MNYVEMLRAFRGLRVIAILLALCLLAAVITRLSLSGQHSPETMIRSIENKPDAIVQHSVLADGTKVTKVDVPSEQTHMIVRQNARIGTEVTIEETRNRAMAGRRHGNLFGNSNYNDIPGTRRELIRIQYNPVIPFEFPVAFTVLTGFILATILAGTLARENDHLELAWTKPVSRERYALMAITIDMGAIVVGFLLTLVVVTACIALFTAPVYAWSHRSLAAIGFALLGPIAWFAMLTAASASLKRGLGAVIGISWPVAIVVTALATGPVGTSAIAQVLYATFHFLNYFNPIGYLSHLSARLFDTGDISVASSPATGLLMLLLLTIVYVAAAVVQWRRVEA
ncbi:MAG: hypothetical protein M3Y18_05720 [Candidatus Eremiobacteraeota bacterium]|nr:hypothetical protein [Candidatus Eremiobacteraeota bacterium]